MSVGTGRTPVYDQPHSDFHIAARTLWKAPLFTTLTVVSLALGSGANTTIFTLLDQVGLRKLPVDRPDGLVPVSIDGASTATRGATAARCRTDVSGVPRSERGIKREFARFDYPMHVGPGAAIERVNGELASGASFPTLRVAAAAGRLFTSEDDMAPGGHPVAVLSFDTGRRASAGDLAGVGRKLTVDGHTSPSSGSPPGVYRHRCRLGDADFRADDDESPDDAGLDCLDDRRAPFARVFARLKPGETAALGRGRSPTVVQIAARRGAEGAGFREARLFQARVSTRLHQGRGGPKVTPELAPFTEPLWTLMAIVIGVLLIAGANVAGLVSHAGWSRQREMAIRLAARRHAVRVLRQLVVESLVLASAGAGLGLSWPPGARRCCLPFSSTANRPSRWSASPDARVLDVQLRAGSRGGPGDGTRARVADEPSPTWRPRSRNNPAAWSAAARCACGKPSW